MTDSSPPPPAPTPPIQEDELVPIDDAIIGVVFRRSIYVLLLLGVVVAAVIYFKPGVAETPAPIVQELRLPAPQKRTVAPPLVKFTNIARESGIRFVRESGAKGKKYLPETMGGGCAFFDFDGDGDPDLLFLNSCSWSWDRRPGESLSVMALYRNDGKGNFEDVTEACGLAIPFHGMGIAAGDYDNDGDVDLFLSAVGPDHLFRNDGGKFTEVTEQARVAGDPRQWSAGAGFFDYDRDGDLDLMVCTYIAWSKEIDEKIGFQIVGIGRAYGPPMQFQGSQVRLYRNDGNGAFTEVSEAAGMRVKNRATGVAVGKSLGIAPHDFDGDGWIDVLVANDMTQKFLFHNQGDGTFREIGEAAGVAYSSEGMATAAMGLDVGFYRDDLTRGIGIGNFANEMTSFFVSSANKLRFTDQAVAEGIGAASRRKLTFGLLFLDYDLDSRLDMIEANGHLEENINIVMASQHYQQTALVFWNCGGDRAPCMVPVPEDTTGDLATPVVGRGLTYADIDGDGDLDLALTQAAGPPLLLRNDQQLGHHFLRLTLRGNGKTCNRDAIGTLVEVDIAGVTQRRVVMPTRSYLSQVELPVTFGLGESAKVDRVRILWTDQTRQELPALAGDRSVLVEQAP